MMPKKMTRRDFVATGTAAGAAMLSGCAGADPLPIPMVHTSPQDSTLQIALVGCGGRGTGAAENCLNSSENVQLVAMGDMFPDRLNGARKSLSNTKGYKVTDENCFTGLDAYKKVLQSSAELVLFATPPGFRPTHFEAAIEAGKHVFLEKPVGVDPTGVRKVIEVGKKAQEKKLGVLSGTQYRHQVSFIETVKRIHDGMIGDLLGGRAYYNTGTLWNRERQPGQSDVEWQLRNWIYFDYLSGDHIVEQHIHTIDATDWVMGGHPVKAVATGGRQVRVEEAFGNIYDHFTVDYEYKGGRHVMSMARQMANVANYVGATFIGTKGEADLYTATIRDLEGKVLWKTPEKPNIAKAYIQEHADLINSIRNGTPINESKRVAESTLTAILGREAAYTGLVVDFDELLGSDLDLAPEGGMGKLALGPNPVRPVPLPGKVR
jgi:predicted dehydrogenase